MKKYIIDFQDPDLELILCRNNEVVTEDKSTINAISSSLIDVICAQGDMYSQIKTYFGTTYTVNNSALKEVYVTQNILIFSGADLTPILRPSDKLYELLLDKKSNEYTEIINGRFIVILKNSDKFIIQSLVNHKFYRLSNYNYMEFDNNLTKLEVKMSELKNKLEPTQRPVLLLDVDGVCIQWQSGLPYFCSQNNLNPENAIEMLTTEEFMSPSKIFGVNDAVAKLFFEEYNKSKYIKYLSAYPDAIEFINKVKSKVDLIAVTAIGTDKKSIMNRAFNLNALFPDAFKDILVCGATASKQSILLEVQQRYKKRIIGFVDDLPSNIDTASDCLDENVPLFYLQRGSISRGQPKAKCHRICNLLELENFLK